MKGGRQVPALVLVAVFSTACGGSSPTAASSGTETLSLKLETPHFRIYSGQAPDSQAHEVGDRLEAELPRLLSDLGVASIGRVDVRIWQDQDSWSAVLTAYFGQRLSASGYITGTQEIRLLAVPGLARNATHELAHVVSLYLSPGFANNPRWLWEAVALYENGEWVDPRTLSYMTSGQPPTLSGLSSGNSTTVYEVGYTLAEFIVVRWGRERLLALVRSNGDLPGVLGLSTAEFEQAWYAWVRERHLS